jgi:hypothetical protein
MTCVCISPDRVIVANGSYPSFVGSSEVLNALVDLLWLTGDANRQAVRDKFAGTYVIRLDAAPAGTGPIRIRPYMFWGMTFFFREVSALTGS